MINTVQCPHCHKDIEINEALTHQIEEHVVSQLKSQHEQELHAAIRSAEEKVGKKIAADMDLQLKDRENETKELRERNAELQKQLLGINKSLRDLKTKDEQRELEMQKQIAQQEQKIKEDTLRQFSDEHRLKDLEKDKQLSDMVKQIEELKQKAQQGSMQLQGEVLELDLEETLRRLFHEDTIEPVGKGVNGADIRHIVKSSLGNVCGVILWESKRTKHWSDDWITKLKEDLRNEKANIPAIVSEQLPEEARRGFGLKDGVWICSPALITPLAMLLRDGIYKVAKQKYIASISSNQAQQMFSYITSHEFSQQIEAMMETFQEMGEQITKERIVLEKTLVKREAQRLRLIKSVISVYGNLQGIAENAMPQVKGMELPELESGN